MTDPRPTPNAPAATVAPRHWSSTGLWGLVLGLSAVGCQTTEVRSVPTTATPSGPAAMGQASADAAANAATGTVPTVPAPGGRQLSADDAVGGDPSAARLHDIEGTLLMYYALHKRLPPHLDDLRPLADPGEDLPLTTPAGRPYLYTPFGLVANGTDRRIIVADPAPSPSGTRPCIVMPPLPGPAGGPLSMDVVSMPESVFRQYVPAQ